MIQSKTNDEPLVSVVLVNWNRSVDILDNIRSLRRQTWKNLEIIVVDNGSTDGSLPALRNIDDIRLIELGQNYGPARGRNEGVRAAAGEFILLLDSDSYIGRTGIEKLVARMQSDPMLGIIGCRVLNWYSGDIDQWFYPYAYEQMGDQEFETYSFSAAGALLRTQAVREAGGFWDELFIYNEEVDLSIGVFRAGYHIIYLPNVPVFHRASPEGRTPSKRYFHYQIRNWIWILYKHYPFWPRVSRISLLSAAYLVKGMRAGQLPAAVGGIVAGVGGTRWIKHYDAKLRIDQVHKLSALNKRWRIRKDGQSKSRLTTTAPQPTSKAR